MGDQGDIAYRKGTPRKGSWTSSGEDTNAEPEYARGERSNDAARSLGHGEDGDGRYSGDGHDAKDEREKYCGSRANGPRLAGEAVTVHEM